MPVRSRGSLLARTAAFAGLIAAGLGCHSSYSDHDSFSIPKTPPPANGGILSRLAAPSMPMGYPAQPVASYGSAPMPTPAHPMTLQPVPIAQVPVNRREVIASTWSPVQRVSAEQPAQGPDLQGSTPAQPISPPPARPVNAEPMPFRVPMPGGNGPTLVGGDAVPPGSIALPPPRLLGSPLPLAAGLMPPAHPSANVPREFEKMALPPYVVEPPDILLIQASPRVVLPLQPIQGQHLVGPDGTVNLGIYGKIRVAGMTLEQVGDSVAARLLEIMPGLFQDAPEYDDKGELKKDAKGNVVKGNLLKGFRRDFTSVELVKKELHVDVLVYNSKFYYVITDGGGYGQQVYPIPIRGNETVLDALANINGLPAVASKRRVWVARATRAGQPQKILPVDWRAVARCGSSETNYQLFPGDRVYVDSSHFIKADSFLSKLYSPVIRTLGITLLGGATVNTISGRSSGLGLGAAGLIR